MKNPKSNNNKRTSSLSNNERNYKKFNSKIFNKKESTNISNKSIIKNINNQNNPKKSVVILEQKTEKGKNIKMNQNTKQKELNINDINKENNITEDKINKIPKYNLILSKEEINKIISNKKNFTNTSKLSKSQSNNNIFKYNSDNITLKNLKEKKNNLYNLINKINTQRNYMKECSLNNLSEKNIIYKNIQDQKMKNLDNAEENFMNKIDLIQAQINNIKNNNFIKFNIKEDINENKDKLNTEYKYKKIKLQNQKICENFKNAKINLEKKLNNLLLLEKEQDERKREAKLKEKIKRTQTLEQKNSELIKDKNYFTKNNNNEINIKNYLYFKLEKSFEEKEKEYINNSKKKKIIKRNEKDIEKKRKEYLNKKRIESMENINNLHKMWKERNNKLIPFKSHLFEKILLSEEDTKKLEKDKIENKKSLLIKKENFIKEKIQLPPINYLLKKENSPKKELIRNKNKINYIRIIKRPNPIENNIIIYKEKSMKSDRDFNYLEELKKGRLSQNKSENYLLSDINRKINIENGKRKAKLLEDHYNMNKKLLRIKGGYANDIDLAIKIDNLLIKKVANKLDMVENLIII